MCRTAALILGILSLKLSIEVVGGLVPCWVGYHDCEVTSRGRGVGVHIFPLADVAVVVIDGTDKSRDNVVRAIDAVVPTLVGIGDRSTGRECYTRNTSGDVWRWVFRAGIVVGRSLVSNRIGAARRRRDFGRKVGIWNWAEFADA